VTMAKQNIDGFKTPADKLLSDEGKKKLFNVFEDFIDAKNRYHMFKTIVKFHDDEKIKTLAREAVEEIDVTKQALKEMIMALDIHVK